MESPKRRKLGWLLLIPVLLVLGVVGALIVWVATPAGPMAEAEDYLQSGDSVEVVSGEWLVFRPKGANPDTGLVLYSGGRVDPASYAPIAYQIAAAGYLVVIPKLPFNLAVLDINVATDVMARYPDVQYWAVGGHSLGGAMAAQYASENQDDVQGLVLWAAYPPNGVEFTQSDIKALTIFGSLDFSREQIEASQSVLPIETIWVEIDGGNHEQFGWYGDQAGDAEATISREEQQEYIIDATILLLSTLKSDE
jgi:hypothetical protein